MLYAIRHITEYQYSTAISENHMEVRKHPLSNDRQRCLNFTLQLEPEVRVFRYQDHLGNVVHHFDVPWAHQELSILGESVVEVKAANGVGHELSWEALDQHLAAQDFYDLLEATPLVDSGPELDSLLRELKVSRELAASPHDLALTLAQGIHQALRYERETTHVDSPMSSALRQRSGVRQDFAHVMLAALRLMRIPCRYISGYRFSSEQGKVDTSHAWVEAFVTEGGWRGYDPSRGQMADETYITNCVGRDYADCPPTRGIFRGSASSTLRYAVHVRPAEQPAREDQFIAT